MRERLNRAVSKTVEPSRVPWVRIPPSPPEILCRNPAGILIASSPAPNASGRQNGCARRGEDDHPRFGDDPPRHGNASEEPLMDLTIDCSRRSREMRATARNCDRCRPRAGRRT